MNAEEIRLNLSHCQYPTRGLGYGRRVGIWLQGCSIHCPGCIVPETWETAPKHNVTLPWLLNELLEWLNEADGVTISGGEPFDQPLALLSLVSALRTLCFGDILVYSGYPWRKLETEHNAVVRRVDVVASEPFVAARHTGMPLVGSANQQVHLLTDLARERYTDWHHFDHEIGICERDGVIYMTGILRPGELTQIAEDLSRRNWKARVTHATI